MFAHDFPGLSLSLFPLQEAEGGSADASHHELLTYVEQALVHGAQRMLVKTELSVGNERLVLACIERLLHCSGARRVLLLLSRKEYEGLIEQAASSSAATGLPRLDRFTLCSGSWPQASCVPQVYVSTLRKVYAQLKQLNRSSGTVGKRASSHADVRSLFDAVVVYERPGTSLMWQTVLHAFDALLIGFSGILDVPALDLFGRMAVCTRRSLPLVQQQLRQPLALHTSSQGDTQESVQPDDAGGDIRQRATI